MTTHSPLYPDWHTATYPSLPKCPHCARQLPPPTIEPLYINGYKSNPLSPGRLGSFTTTCSCGNQYVWTFPNVYRQRSLVGPLFTTGQLLIRCQR